MKKKKRENGTKKNGKCGHQWLIIEKRRRQSASVLLLCINSGYRHITRA